MEMICSMDSWLLWKVVYSKNELSKCQTIEIFKSVKACYLTISLKFLYKLKTEYIAFTVFFVSFTHNSIVDVEQIIV